MAAVLYDQSKIGVPYDILEDPGSGFGYYSKFPQYSGTGTLFPGGGTAYSGTLAWLRVKRISGVACNVPNNINIVTTDGSTIGFASAGVAVGDYCDFPISGPNLTNQAVGYIGICITGDCSNRPGTLILDGSPENEGYILDGTQTMQKTGGWAFQLCDSGGCSGGFEEVLATSTPTTTPATGASSVLFLPGIQASQLYKDSLLGRDQIWPPNALFNEDIYDLSMSIDGVSEQEIYTEDIVDTTAGVGDVYASFQGFLKQLKDEETIDDWEDFAYDWRYSVTDVAQNGTQYESEIKDAVREIERLASSSFTGKVTIIGHSNGGLLAKAIMLRLADEGKTALVDKIVFLASPQLGTPKSIGTILHGYDQTDVYLGVVTNAQSAREVINNLPGAYGLLPSEKYFEGLDTPLVVFNDTSVTAPYRQAYGANISSYEEYVRFVRGGDTFDRDIDGPTSQPARANSRMLDEALLMHGNQLDDWVAPNGVEVIEIIGTGLSTMKSIEYREVIENKCSSAGPTIVCTPESEIKPYAVLTKYGDGTVVQRSAEGYGGEKQKYFLNLKALEDVSLGSEYVHHNITEAPPLQDLFSDILSGTSTQNNQFISTFHTEFTDSYDVEIIDSPVRLLSTDSEGNQTGVVVVDGERIIKQEIPGSQYFEFGDTKYFVVPKGTDRTTRLYGEDYGGYTLTIAELDSDDTQTIQTELKNATTTPTLVAEYSNQAGVFGTVLTDEDGDGETDYEMTLEGELVKEEVVITYPLLMTTIGELNLSKVRKQALLLIIKSAEYYAHKIPPKSLYLKLEDGLLNSVQELIMLYEKKRYLSASDVKMLLEMIKTLKDKQ
ncbi:MAG: hypothetical protein KBB78_01995 [Candidatus Pacebacteria bacterium]|nr:hypothetical protein [Candidatus Paceibacterota bacterium]